MRESQLSGDTGSKQRAVTVSVFPVANYLWHVAWRIDTSHALWIFRHPHIVRRHPIAANPLAGHNNPASRWVSNILPRALGRTRIIPCFRLA